jgi:allantoinase
MFLDPPLASGESSKMPQAFRSKRVVTPQGMVPATLLIENGRIAGLRAWNEAPAEGFRDFGDAVILPGLVDPHVHINEPGRTDWEGFTTATRAAAAGGVTTLVDMPLNCIPETVDLSALNAKRDAAKGKALVDWAAWGGVVRGNSDALPGLIGAGVPGFKCFMIHSGIDGFAWVDETELRLALKLLRGTGLPLLAHAEVSAPVSAATEALNASSADWRSYATYLASRPDDAEVQAIALLIQLAEEFETPIHIVHLSTAKALPLIANARRKGIRISVETCAHYLRFAAEDIPDGATEYKCTPPIREAENGEELWSALDSGLIDMIVTDHSPCPAEMKHREKGRWDEAWGGIAGLGLALPIVWTEMYHRQIPIERIAQWMAASPARLAGLWGKKGSLTACADADFVVFDPDIPWIITRNDLHFRHKLSPYIGAHLYGIVLETWLRGKPVYCNGQFTGDPRGEELVHT